MQGLMLSGAVRGVRGHTSLHAKLVKRSISGSSAHLAKILLSDATDKICAEVFKARGHIVDSKPGLSKEELKKIIGEYDGLVVRSATKVTKDLLEAAPNLKVVGRAGTGVDNIDVPAATMKGVLVVNTPGGNTISTAELTFSHMLALSRNIPQAVASLKAGKWERNKYTGTELGGKTLGIIGLGRIGTEVARWARAFGMQTIGFDPIVSASAARAAGIEPVPLDDLFAKCDFITLHTPLTKDTRNLIRAENLKKCKQGVRIINCARGGIINENDLLDALNSGHVAGASLDVFAQEPPTEAERPLILHPKVVASPHLGANTKDAQVRVAKDIAVQLSDILSEKDFVGVVNAPNIDFARKSKLIPYLSLAEKIGSLQAQLIGSGKIRRIVITLQGQEVAVPELSESIKIAVLKGTLSHLLDQEVNFLSAGPQAEAMGLQVSTSLTQTSGSGGDHANIIKVEYELDGLLNFSRSITGTVFGSRHLRIIDIDGFKTDIPPSGSVLFFNNIDKPGILKSISSVLSKGSCNIAHFSLGRQLKAGKALGAITLDEPAPPKVVEEIKALKDISNVSQVQLLDMPDRVFRIHQKDEPAIIAGDARPSIKPANPQFSSGPTKKRPGYSIKNLPTDCLGRSHRSKLGKAKLKHAIEESKRILGLPSDYLLGIVPASDTGAYEMAMWNTLGPRPVDIFHWESFGKGWYQDAVSHLGLKDTPGVHEYSADYGMLPDFTKANPKHDILFTYNGTTSGARVPDCDWISPDREGLTLNDATSAAFAMNMDWSKLDITTYSWQKVLGGEGAHGVLILSPRAVERLETFKPTNRPLPKIFRMVKKGKIDKDLFEGATINTPSMLAVEDYIDALQWADSIGGLPGLINRSVKNYKVVEKFVEENEWIDFLVKDPKIRSTTSVCLSLNLTKDQVKQFTALLEKENVALDFGSYRDAPPGLRLWCGATVEHEDLEALMPWLKWAYHEVGGK